MKDNENLLEYRDEIINLMYGRLGICTFCRLPKNICNHRNTGIKLPNLVSSQAVLDCIYDALVFTTVSESNDEN